MPTVRFTAPEYNAEGSFARVTYEFQGTDTQGWSVRREDREVLRLGPGYKLLRSNQCGVCSTDLARHFLPYPLPQIIGHEVVALDDADRPVVVEINASHLARGEHADDCPFCSGGLATQCPARITLGIDRLPGGFAPYMLAPQDAILPVPAAISPRVATLTEPFAAALHGVERSAPVAGESVAVLGPRRLGMLTLAALLAYRRDSGIDFEIVAVVRHDRPRDLCKLLGVDRVVDTRETELTTMKAAFDLVFDTTGKPDGLAAAYELAGRAVHLKSTHGRAIAGLDHLSDLVVDELTLRAFCPRAATEFGWPDESSARENLHVFVGPGVSEETAAKINAFRAKTGRPAATLHRESFAEGLERVTAAAKSEAALARLLPGATLPRFDLALVAAPTDIDRVIRPEPEREVALVRPRGVIFYCKDASSPGAGADFEPLAGALGRGVSVDSSRCGSFARALELLEGAPEVAAFLESHMITHEYDLEHIEEAFLTAADSASSIKVLVNTLAKTTDS